MDLASGIAGLTSLALELTTITYHYIREVRNAPEESKQFHEELNALKTNLEELQKFLVAHDAPQMPFTKTSALVVSINVCKDDLNYLKDKLVDFKRVYEKRKWYRRLAWPFQREEHTQVLRRIKDYTQTFHFSISLEGCSLLAKTSKEIGEIHKQQRDSSSDVSEIYTIVAGLDTTIKYFIDHQLEEIRTSLEILGDERYKLLDWLSKVDPSTNHNAASETKEPETGEWFLKSDSFTQWVESVGFIWLHGIPGCGKTVLCSSIIECIQDLCYASGSCKAAYFYFNFQAAAEQNLNVVLRSLLRQLSANETRFPSAVQKLYDKHYAIGHSPSTKELKEAFKETIEYFGKEVYIMIDALDEVLDKKERSKILEHFANLASSRLGNLHFLATSRDEWDIRESFRSLSEGGTSLQSHGVDADIRKYVASCLKELTEVPQEMKPLIQDKVGAEAHGMFRWATCQIETIRECRTIAEIEKALDDLPHTLDETYERVLKNIWRLDAEKGRAILTWLLFSERPLTLREMAEAAVLRPGDTKLDPRDRLSLLSGVLSICRGLIILSNEGSIYSPSIRKWNTVRCVRFAHFSVKEYLVSGRSEVFTGLPIPSHEYIGNCCISMLLPIDHVGLQSIDLVELQSIGHVRLQSIDHFGLRNQMLKKSSRDQYLLPYAALSWTFHIKQLEAHGKVPGNLSHDVCKLLDHGPDTENYHMWMSLYNEARWKFHATWVLTSEKYGEGKLLLCQPPLFYACRLGLVGETHRCIEAGSDINQCVHGLGTPLHVASKGKNPKITEILLHYGADVKIRDNEGRTAFGIAMSYGNEESRRLLVDHGIDINDELKDAIRECELETVRFLLEHGANGNHALQDAVHSRHFDIVQLMVEKSADLNSNNCASALFVAASIGHLKIFELLLERRTYISGTEGHDAALLMAAVDGGSLGITSRLVKSGVDINAPASIKIDAGLEHYIIFYSTALHYASYMCDLDMIKYLLKNGAKIDAPGFSLGTELQAALLSHASSRSHVSGRRRRLHDPMRDTLLYLIKSGANVNQQLQTRSLEIPSTPPFRKKGTALQQAAAQDLDSIAQLLVTEGAEIDLQHNHCGTALMCASRHGEPGTLRVLIDMEADVNGRVAGLGSALTDAAKWGRCENVRFLIENGADVDAEVEGIGNALLTALQYGQFGTAAVLVEAGADLHSTIQDMGRAFSVTSEHEAREIIKCCFACYRPYPKWWDDEDRKSRREQSSGGRKIESCI